VSETVFNLLALIGVAVGATALGSRVLAVAGFRASRPWAIWLLGSGLGLGLLSLVVLLLGSLGLLSRPAVLGVIGAGLVLALVRAPSIGRRWAARAARRRALAQLRPLGWIAAGFLGAAAVLNLIGALAPPTGSDEMNYHLALPKLFAEAQRTVFLPSHRLSTTPMTMEMLYTLAMLVRSATTAQLLNWYLGVLSLATVIVLAREFFDATTALVAAALFYAVTAVSALSAGALAELGSAAFALLCALALLHWRRTGAWRWLWLAGALAGFYAGTKLPNALGVVVLGIGIGVYARRAGAGRAHAWRGAAVFCAAGLVLAGIWFARSWAMTGNPVYPYLSTVFGGQYLPLGRMQQTPQLSVIGRSDPLLTPGVFLEYRHPVKLLLSPWLLTMDGARFRGYPGPILLGLLPAVLWALRRCDPHLRFLVWVAGLFYLTWFVTYSLLRNALPVLALFAIPTAGVLASVTRRRGAVAAMAGGAFALWLAVSLLGIVDDHGPAVPVALGRESPQAYLGRRLPEPRTGFPYYDAYRFMNTHLPADSVVLLWDTRGFYLDRAYIRSWEFLHGLADPARLRSRDGVVRELQRWRITHVAMTDEPKRLWFRSLLATTGRLRCLYDDGAMTICAVRPDGDRLGRPAVAPRGAVPSGSW
jgi:hypothetical protein